jgi:type II secretory pathway pseudopilin PulG
MQRPPRDRRAHEAGLTLTEALMAVVVSVIILTAIAFALATGLKSNQVVKANEQATGLANKQIEAARNKPFDDLNHLTSDIAADSAVTGVSPNLMFTPIPGRPAEKIVHSAAANPGHQIALHETTEAIQGLNFTVKTYVTVVDPGSVVDGSLNQTRRVTTIVSYKHAGTTFHATSSTVITRTRRGLPEPKFEVTTNPSAIFGAWNTNLVLFHTIRNLGVTDAYDIKAPVPSRPSWTGNFSFRADVNGDGFYTPATDTALADTNGNGFPDTGNVVTDDTIGIFIVYQVPPTEPFGSATVATTIASGASSTVQQTVTDAANINYGLDVFYPYNQRDFTYDGASPPNVDQPTDSALVGTFSDPEFPWPMRMDANPPGENNVSTGAFEPFAVLPDYSTNQGSTYVGPGRVLRQRPAGTPAFNGALTAAEAPYVAAWDHQVDNAVFGPAAYLYIWVANHKDVGSSNCDKPVKLKVYLNRVTGLPTNAPTAIATAPLIWSKEQALGVADPEAKPSWQAGRCEFTWQLYGGAIPDTTYSTAGPATTKYLQIRVVMDDPGRTEPVLLGYGINYSADPKLDIDFPTQLYMYRKS